MAKFNAKKEAPKPTAINFMGEKAFEMKPAENLISTCMTTFLTDSYYESESETCDRIAENISKVDPIFAAKCAIYVRTVGNMRSVSHFMAACIAKYASGTEWGQRFFDKIVVRPDDMSEILCCYSAMNGNKDFKDIKKIPNALKKGFRKALESLDAYQIDKYKMKSRQISLVDLANLFHPRPTDQLRAEAWRRLIAGESFDGLYESKILQKEMSAAGQATKDLSDDEKEVAKTKAITASLNDIKGMPIFTLLRNLRNIIEHAPDQVDEACRQLTIEKKILNSKLLPFRFATAFKEIEYMPETEKSVKTSIQFESDVKTDIGTLKKKVLDAIEAAMQISCKNIPQLEGNIAVLVDHSGSVRGNACGASKVSAFSKTTYAMIGNLFGSMMVFAQDNVYLGLFGDRLISVPIDRSKGLLKFNQESFNLGAKCGGSTEAGIYEFIRTAVKEKKKIDNIIVFSDCQIGNGENAGATSWYGEGSDRSGEFQRLFKEFKKINPVCNWVVCNIKQAGGTSVFDKSQRILNIAGWSDKIFNTITSNCKGWSAVIKEINEIEL